ncbi:MAG: RNA 2',3'-cyclic phosphodiesterase [Promethearchaeota archaeon]
MIRSFIAIELKDKETIDNIKDFSLRIKKNQPKIKTVEPENLHMTIKFLGDITESLAPKIFDIIKEVNEKFFQGKTFKYDLKGVGQFNRFSIIWVKLIGNISLLQTIKDTLEDLLNKKLNLERDKRPQFKPHLTIGRLNKKRIDYKTFESFKNIIKENKEKEFGSYNIGEIKLKKSVLTPKGPIYSDLVY